MSLQDIAAGMARACQVLARRPELGMHDDSPATARWRGGVRNVALHANGTAIETDMAEEIGGTGDRVTPGWLFRAGLASCAVTSIAMRAAAEGVALTALEAHVESRTDLRGMLAMAGGDGAPVHAGPAEMHLRIRIAAEGMSADALRALVARGCRCSPVPTAVTTPTPLSVHVEVT